MLQDVCCRAAYAMRHVAGTTHCLLVYRQTIELLS